MDRSDGIEGAGRGFLAVSVPMTIAEADTTHLSHSKSAPKGGENSSTDRGFDRWLNRQLHKLYDPVLEERIPTELERLIDQFDKRSDLGDDENAHASTGRKSDGSRK